ncbi:Nicotinamide riboside kinase [Ophiocordyceps camponoti-floridani]|uniref:Nicotinamide riboside kinase n=1 Tax=Ophiocordyceps camponoti-floridani TaxID=2030778 RepID=A0A8H4Q5K9_9HYPO|nr:Nicotinamide riboside kinase [Ophiocordyceps camponoti-floridani]
MSPSALIVAISGCSSSGKTTLARLVRNLFPGTFILHQDDFYRPEAELPFKNGLRDWDCAEAVDVPAMMEALTYIHHHASFPPTLESKEDQNAIGNCPIPSQVINTLKSRIETSLPPSHPLLTGSLRLCLLDGFLLYAKSMAALQPSLDVKLFVRASYASAKARREARAGYVTIEGFWEDPPGYVEAVVWPNYVADHGWMFEGADVEGPYRKDALESAGIRTLDDEKPDVDLAVTLEWMVNTILQELHKYA